MFKDYDELHNLQETTDLLAHAWDWPELYDEAQLTMTGVPIYSAVYVEDMLAHFNFFRVWTHSTHDSPVLDRLLGLGRFAGA